MSQHIEQMRALGRLIADDGFAVSFQSLGQYRSALLAEVAKALEPPRLIPPPTTEWRCGPRCERCKYGH